MSLVTGHALRLFSAIALAMMAMVAYAQAPINLLFHPTSDDFGTNSALPVTLPPMVRHLCLRNL
jgi:hypothetical protein